MNPSARNLATPAESSSANILQIQECLTFEKALPYVPDGVFNYRLVFWVIRPCRIGNETSMRCIFHKRSREARCVRVRIVNAGLHVIDHHPLRTSLKELQTPLEAIDDARHVLTKDGDYTTQSAVAQRHDESVNHPR